MSFLSLLVNTVSVARPSVAYSKGRSTKSYATVTTGVRCNIQFTQGGARFGSQQTTAHGYEIAEGWWAAFVYGEDILKDDQLTDEKGRVFIVKSSPQDVVGREHHIECSLAIVEQ